VGVVIMLISLTLTQFMRPVAERVAVVATAGD